MVEEKNPGPADRITRAHLEKDRTIFEGSIIESNFVVRPDVLIRKGNTLYIIEVKSKIGNIRQHREGKMFINMYGDVRAAYKEIVYDLAFQVEVLRLAFPNLSIVPYFLLPEEQARSSKEEVTAARNEEQISLPEGDEDVLKTRRSKSVLKFFPAGQAIERIRATASATMDVMSAAWKSGKRPTPRLRYGCRNCEFRLKGSESDDGYHRCWGALAKPKPHLFDLHQLYQLKTPENKQALLADQKIQEGKTSLFDIVESDLHGEHAARQRLQLNCQKSGKEWIDPKLGEEIAKLQWPIAFLDFETSMAAIPGTPG